jgi:hypothetical protein
MIPGIVTALKLWYTVLKYEWSKNHVSIYVRPLLRLRTCAHAC